MSAAPAGLTSRVYVTGTGVISCAGQNSDALWESAHSGKSGIVNGIGPVDFKSLDLSILDSFPNLAESLRADLSADSEQNSALVFSLLAIAHAMNAAGWKKLESEDGLIFATTTGQIPIWDKALIAYLKKEIKREEFDRVFAHQPLGTLLDSISDRLDFSGRSFITSTACTAATQALALGAEWISQRRVKRCLVVGTEVLCTLTLEGFKSLQLLSQQSAKPFDAERKGINLSEGSAALCLEGESAGDNQKTDLQQRALARISGLGLTTDSYHMTAPEPNGRGCRDAILLALNLSGLQPNDISWIHAHGTGSPHNDSAEGSAIFSVFGEDGPLVTSTKGIHGHSLGASGAVESVLCIEALKRNEILATYGLVNPDTAIKVKVARTNQLKELRHILKLTLGFGGANAAIIFSAPDSIQINSANVSVAPPAHDKLVQL